MELYALVERLLKSALLFGLFMRDVTARDRTLALLEPCVGSGVAELPTPVAVVDLDR